MKKGGKEGKNHRAFFPILNKHQKYEFNIENFCERGTCGAADVQYSLWLGV